MRRTAFQQQGQHGQPAFRIAVHQVHHHFKRLAIDALFGRAVEMELLQLEHAVLHRDVIAATHAHLYRVAIVDHIER